jgi:hypothetical protein
MLVGPDGLPPELVDLIFAKCNAKTLARLECVSKETRAAAQRAPIQLHVTPTHFPRIWEWADSASRKARITKVSFRRTQLYRNFDAYPNVQSISMLYCKVWNLNWMSMVGPRLKRLEISRLKRSWDMPTSFQLSVLPGTLTSAALQFDDSWTAVDVDDTKNIVSLTLKAPYGIGLHKPDILLGNTGVVRKLQLETPGRCIPRPGFAAPAITYLHIESTNDTPVVLKHFPGVAALVAILPQCDLVWSVDMHMPNLAAAVIDVDFLSIDAISEKLTFLEVWADRIATKPLPKSLVIRAFVRDVDIPRAFFD